MQEIRNKSLEFKSVFSVEVTNFIVLGVTDKWVIQDRFLSKMRRGGLQRDSWESSDIWGDVRGKDTTRELKRREL